MTRRVVVRPHPFPRYGPTFSEIFRGLRWILLALALPRLGVIVVDGMIKNRLVGPGFDLPQQEFLEIGVGVHRASLAWSATTSDRH